MEYSNFIEPLVMFRLDYISRHFGVALIKRPNITEYNYVLSTPLIDIFGDEVNLGSFLKRVIASKNLQPKTDLAKGNLLELVTTYFHAMQDTEGLYPNIAEIYYSDNRPRLVIKPSDLSNGFSVECESYLKDLIAGWFKEIYTEQTTKTLIPTVLGVQEIIHLQSFFPDDFKFDPKAVYELFPINGLSLAVNAVSAINPFVTMQRDKKHIASFTFQGFVVRQTLQCLRIKSINRDKTFDLKTK